MAPDVVLASDFTFICCRGSFVYLCKVIDVLTGEVLGFNISRTHDANFVLLAIKRAVEKTATVPKWFHSDQGSEYASNRVQSFLESRGVTISMNPIMKSQGIPDFQAPPLIPKFIGTAQAIDELPSYDSFEPSPDDF